MGKNYPDLAVPSIHSGWWLNYFFQSFFYLPPPLVIAGPINYPYPITAQVKVTFINTSWLMFGCTGGVQGMQSYCSFHSYDFDCD